MNINEAFPSSYLKASDLQGTQPVVVIDRVEVEAVGRQKDMKAIVYFRGKDKGLVLNKTNATMIMKITESPVTEEWAGHAICLFSTHVEYQGESVEAIRVKAAPTPRRKPAPVVQPVAAEVAFDGDDDVVPF